MYEGSVQWVYMRWYADIRRWETDEDIPAGSVLTANALLAYRHDRANHRRHYALLWSCRALSWKNLYACRVDGGYKSTKRWSDRCTDKKRKMFSRSASGSSSNIVYSVNDVGTIEPIIVDIMLSCDPVEALSWKNLYFPAKSWLAGTSQRVRRVYRQEAQDVLAKCVSGSSNIIYSIVLAFDADRGTLLFLMRQWKFGEVSEWVQ
jgi:hypothetical protein